MGSSPCGDATYDLIVLKVLHLYPVLLECGQVPAYNRHTLPGETEPVEQAKEILILRQKSWQIHMNQSDLDALDKEVGRHGVGIGMGLIEAHFLGWSLYQRSQFPS